MHTKHQIEKQLVTLFETKETVSDKDIAGLAKQLGIAEPDLEEVVYGLLTAILYRNKDTRNLDPVEVKRGTKHEMEHTTNPLIARKIALDHILERENYYQILESVMPD